MSSFNLQDYTSFLKRPERIVQPFPWIEHIPFAFFLVEFLKPERIVELGVHTGNSYNAFCQQVKAQGGHTKCYGIDTWKGEEQAGLYEDNVFHDLNNYQKEIYSDFSTLVRSTFDEALEKFEKKSIDLLHIDGLHTYDAVKHDFETWLPKVKEGGVILFHDTQVRREGFGVWKLWSEISPKYDSFEFKHCNGLGILLVGNNPKFQSFLSAIREGAFLNILFTELGGKISYAAQPEHEKAEAHNMVRQMQAEISALHTKVESMRIKNRIKRLFLLK